MAAFAATILSACTQKEVEVKDQPVTITASFAEDIQSKAAVVNGTSLYWSTGDRIKIFHEGCTGAASYSGVAAPSASFSGTFGGTLNFGRNNIYCLYPYSDKAEFDGNNFIVTLSDQQTVTGGNTGDGNICVARSGNMNMKFYPVCGGVRFTLDRNDISSVTLTAHGSVTIAGKVSVGFQNNYPSIKTVIDPCSSITLNAPEGKYLEAGQWYYINTLPANLTAGFTLTLHSGDKKGDKDFLSADTIYRGCYNSFTSVDYGVELLGEGEQPGEGFEPASVVIKKLKLGWNLAGTLESHGIACENNTTLRCNGDRLLGYETGWNQPKVIPEIFPEMKKYGIEVIRFPVTWYPWMDENGDVDKRWLDRAEEIVNYILDADMYCIIDVHHDAGSMETRWVTADPARYAATSVRFKHLWKQLASRFAGYGPKLIFEAYNEILDAECKWHYTDAASYATANQLNQDFVNTVRETGGNNKYRILVCNNYATATDYRSCQAYVMPTDIIEDRIMGQVHSYLPYNFAMNPSDASKSQREFYESDIAEIRAALKSVYDNQVSKGIPMILGEFGAYDKDCNEDARAAHAYAYASICKEYGIVPIIWNELMEKQDRASVSWTSPKVRDAIVKAIYGE